MAGVPDRRPGEGRGRLALLVQPAAHALHEVLQHVDFVDQFLGALGVVGDGLQHLAKPRVERLDLGEQDGVRLADRLDVALDGAGFQRALDQAVEGEAEPEPAHQGGHGGAPAAPVPPQRQRDDQRQAEIGCAEKPKGEPSHGPAIRITRLSIRCGAA